MSVVIFRVLYLANLKIPAASLFWLQHESYLSLTALQMKMCCILKYLVSFQGHGLFDAIDFIVIVKSLL